MSYKVLYSLWAVMFVLTGALGFVPSPEGVLKFVLQALTVSFFIPGWLILIRARKEDNFRHCLTVRNLCLASLGCTVVLIALNLMSLSWSEAVGNILHAALTIICAPMICGNAYILSLFLWGCLLMASVSRPNTNS